MSDGSNPTQEQKNWLASVLGKDAWSELQKQPDFLSALEVSLGLARQIALKYLASKSLAR